MLFSSSYHAPVLFLFYCSQNGIISTTTCLPYRTPTTITTTQIPLPVCQLKVLNVLGVEACRASIVSEMISVFGVYGIDVDTRHLGLIADYMTFMGGFRPVSRAGMMDAASACLQMSFEVMLCLQCRIILFFTSYYTIL